MNKIYGTTSSGRSISTIMPGADASIQKLSLWIHNLPSSLQLQDEGVSDRARLILHMMYNQLLILTNRPFLFVAVKQAVAALYIPPGQHRSYSNYLSYLTCCADAARRNAQLTRQLVAANQASIFSTLDYHYAFNAAIVLQLSRLVPEVVSPTDEGDANFLQSYLYETGGRGNESAGDCARMIMEFGSVLSRLLGSPSAVHQSQHAVVMTKSSEPSGDTVNQISSQPQLMNIPQQETQPGENGNIGPLLPDWNFDITGSGSMAVDMFAWFQDMSY